LVEETRGEVTNKQMVSFYKIDESPIRASSKNGNEISQDLNDQKIKASFNKIVN
jgi:hypothetical protein